MSWADDTATPFQYACGNTTMQQEKPPKGGFFFGCIGSDACRAWLALPPKTATLPLRVACMPCKAASMTKNAASMPVRDAGSGEKSGRIGTCSSVNAVQGGNRATSDCTRDEKSGVGAAQSRRLAPSSADIAVLNGTHAEKSASDAGQSGDDGENSGNVVVRSDGDGAFQSQRSQKGAGPAPGLTSRARIPSSHHSCDALWRSAASRGAQCAGLPNVTGRPWIPGAEIQRRSRNHPT